MLTGIYMTEIYITLDNATIFHKVKVGILDNTSCFKQNVLTLEILVGWILRFGLNFSTGRTPLPKSNFAVKFPIGLWLILQLQKKIQTLIGSDAQNY